MTEQQNEENEANNLLPPDEAKAAIEKWFASMIGTLSLNNATLEKQLSNCQKIVRQLTENEVGLVEHIQDLKAEIAQLKQRLPLSPEAAALAAEGSVLLADDEDEGNKKAAPVEAA